jgi:hypothetical protein
MKKTQKKTVKKKSPRVPGRRRGRPRFVPTEKQREAVALLCGVGLTYVEIAACVTNPSSNAGISTTVLQREFKEELAGGQAKVKGKVLGNLVRHACGTGPGSVTAAIFLAKVRYGWREVQEIEITNTGVLVAPARMTPEDWIADQQSNNRLSPSNN